MSACTSCGTGDIWIGENVECVHVETYQINAPGSPRRRDVRDRADWQIALCRTCAERRLDEELRRTRRLALLVGPVLVGGGIVSAVILTGITYALGAGGPFAVMAILACGLVSVVGIIRIPLGLWRAAAVSAKLARLRSRQGTYAADDEDRWEMIGAEGLRIAESLEKGKRDYFGEFILPKGEAQRAGGTLSYEIRKRKGPRFKSEDVLRITFREGRIRNVSEGPSCVAHELKAPNIPNDLLEVLRVDDFLSLADSYGKPSDQGEFGYGCIEVETRTGSKRLEICDPYSLSGNTEEERQAFRIDWDFSEYFRTKADDTDGATTVKKGDAP